MSLKTHLAVNGRSVFSDSVCVKPSPAVARCNCCKIDYGVSDWLKLEMVGIQRDENGKPMLEYRNCSCGSPIARDLEE